jgi:hypothetical protein
MAKLKTGPRGIPRSLLSFVGVTGLEADYGGGVNRNGDAELAAKSPRCFESFMPAGAGACRGIPWGGTGLGHRYGTGAWRNRRIPPRHAACRGGSCSRGALWIFGHGRVAMGPRAGRAVERMGDRVTVDDTEQLTSRAVFAGAGLLAARRRRRPCARSQAARAAVAVHRSATGGDRAPSSATRWEAAVPVPQAVARRYAWGRAHTVPSSSRSPSHSFRFRRPTCCGITGAGARVEAACAGGVRPASEHRTRGRSGPKLRVGTAGTTSCSR